MIDELVGLLEFCTNTPKNRLQLWKTSAWITGNNRIFLNVLDKIVLVKA